jgi:hypothetical protein
MALLNWRDAQIKVETSTHKGKTECRLTLSQISLRTLIEYLNNEVYGHEISSEMRMYLPSGWTLFWKKKEGESRAVVAHPEPDHWVGTLALEDSYSEDYFSALKNLTQGQSLSLAQASSMNLSAVSNLDLVFIVSSG